MSNYTLHHGDCLDVLPTLEADSVDSVITDPPYGLSFMGKDWDYGIPGARFWREVLRVAKPGATLLAFGGTRTHHRLTCAIEDAGWEIRDVIMWVYGSGFPKSHNISKAIDRAAGKLPPENKGFTFAGYSHMPDKLLHTAPSKGYIPPEPATEAAQTWDGWGTALKPAWEPIIVAMKPRDGTFAHNALTHGVAGLWIDGGRVEANGEATGANGNFGFTNERGWNINNIPERQTIEQSHTLGRFPANLIHDGSAEVVELFPHDAARFFYCAKASRSERNAGCDGLEERSRPLQIQQSSGRQLAGKAESMPSANHHPTVKPLALMRYLCRITKTPTWGVVLDPFMGSGSTGCAAIMEGRDFIGIEQNADYVEIARCRIEYAAQQRMEQVRHEPQQLALAHAHE